MKLRFGLNLWLVAVLAVAITAVVAVAALVLRREQALGEEVLQHSRSSIRALVFGTTRAQGEGQARRLADALVNPLYYFDLDAIGRVIGHVARDPAVQYVIVYSPTGEVIHDGSRDIATFGQEMDDRFAAEAVASETVRVQGGGDMVDVSVPIRLGGKRLGGVRIGYSLQSAEEAANRATAEMREQLQAVGRSHLQGLIILVLALMALGTLLVMLVQRTLVQPVRQLADAAREIEAGNYGAEVPASRRNDELGDLMRAFRRMGESIARHDRDIRRIAYTDALSGLDNRIAFRELLDQRLAAATCDAPPLALLFADIDDFKRVNDTLGHDAGDEVLLHFAERIREVAERHAGDRPAVARFGGDEFVILAQAGDGEDVRALAERLAMVLVDELRRPILVRGRQVFLGISVGVTVFPDDATSVAMLMKNADIAMYQAKLAGKSCHRFYSRAMDQAVERRVRMEQDLRGAWERGELSLVYQPVFRTSDTQLVGAESLLRWEHPTHGPVPPSVFIEVAEQSGLIETLGEAVLRAACKDAARWRRTSGQDELFVSVNVSPRQLRKGNLVKQVEQALSDASLPARWLHLELTETAVMGDELHVRSLLQRLRKAGVQVWLDDFGTGFSGLSHLRRVPVDGVKIDRSFVADVLDDADDLALTTAIIAMAHSLNMSVVAEGVERKGQFDLLRERGCDLAQGYWLGYPMPAAEFAQLLT